MSKRSFRLNKQTKRPQLCLAPSLRYLCSSGNVARTKAIGEFPVSRAERERGGRCFLQPAWSSCSARALVNCSKVARRRRETGTRRALPAVTTTSPASRRGACAGTCPRNSLNRTEASNGPDRASKPLLFVFIHVYTHTRARAQKEGGKKSPTCERALETEKLHFLAL